MVHYTSILKTQNQNKQKTQTHTTRNKKLQRFMIMVDTIMLMLSILVDILGMFDHILVRTLLSLCTAFGAYKLGNQDGSRPKIAVICMLRRANQQLQDVVAEALAAAVAAQAAAIEAQAATLEAQAATAEAQAALEAAQLEVAELQATVQHMNNLARVRAAMRNNR